MAELYKRSNSPYWYVAISTPTGIVRKSTGTRNKKEALLRAREMGLLPDKEEEANTLRWLDATEIYFARAELKVSTQRGYEAMVKPIALSSLGDFRLATLTHEQLRDFANKRRGDVVRHTSRIVKQATIRRQLSFISSVYSLLIDHGIEGLPKTNPLKTFERSFLKESPVVDRYLVESQFEKVLVTCKKDIHRRMLCVLLGTGMREKELIKLRWGEIDFETNRIEFGNMDTTRTKNGRSRVIPLIPLAKEALLAHFSAQFPGKSIVLRDVATQLVFPSPKSTDTMPLQYRSLDFLRKAIQRNSGIKSFTIHSLRHTFASWSLQNGVDALAIQKILGHSTLSMAARYARHLDNTAAEQFIDKVSHTFRTQPAVSQGTSETAGKKGR